MKIIFKTEETKAEAFSSQPHSSRRGRPPKQGLGSLSSYEDFNEDDPVQMKKYRVDEKDSPHGDLNGEKTIYLPLPNVDSSTSLKSFPLIKIMQMSLKDANVSPAGKSKYSSADYAPSAMHMQFMQMNQHRLAQSNAIMGSEMQAQHLQRAIEENNNKNTNIANLNRANLWETCSASYESFVKNLER